MQKQTASEQDRTTGVMSVIAWRVKSVSVPKHLTLAVAFNDGTQGLVTIDPKWLTGVFRDLQAPDTFAQAFVEHGAVTWPNGLDLAPDSMYKAIKAHGHYTIQ